MLNTAYQTKETVFTMNRYSGTKAVDPDTTEYKKFVKSLKSIYIDHLNSVNMDVNKFYKSDKSIREMLYLYSMNYRVSLDQDGKYNVTCNTKPKLIGNNISIMIPDYIFDTPRYKTKISIKSYMEFCHSKELNGYIL